MRFRFIKSNSEDDLCLGLGRATVWLFSSLGADAEIGSTSLPLWLDKLDEPLLPVLPSGLRSVEALWMASRPSMVLTVDVWRWT